MYTVEANDLEYARHGDSPLLLRLYRPKGDGPFPGVVEVHGGGWTTGDRLQNARVAEYLAARGVVVASLDFRMPPTAGYPHPIADISFGVRWLKAHAREFGVAPDKVGGLGSSSGGHQLLLAALRPSDPRYSALSAPGIPTALKSDLRFLVASWPVSDPLLRFRMAQERNIARLLQAHADYWPNEAAMEDGNPMRLVEAGRAESLPPLLLIQGGADASLPDGMNDRFAAAYRRAGGDAVFEYFPDQPHTFVTVAPDSEATQRALALIAAFVAKHGA